MTNSEKIDYAKNTNTSASVLEKLSSDNNKYIRYHVAKNPSTPIEILEKLSNDDHHEVRFVSVNVLGRGEANRILIKEWCDRITK